MSHPQLPRRVRAALVTRRHHGAERGPARAARARRSGDGRLRAPRPGVVVGTAGTASSAPRCRRPLDYDHPHGVADRHLGDPAARRRARLGASARCCSTRAARRLRRRLRPRRRQVPAAGAAGALRHRRVRPARHHAAAPRCAASTPSTRRSPILPPFPYPDTPAEEQVQRASDDELAAACARHGGPSSTTCPPPTPPATWTCCARRSATGS